MDLSDYNIYRYSRLIRHYTVIFFNSISISYTTSFLSEFFQIASRLFRYNRCYTPPEITPHPSATFPRIRIHDLKIIYQPRILKLSNIRACGTKARSTKRCPASLIQIQLQRLCQAPRWEICRRIAQGVAGGAKAICYGGRNRRVVLRNEITPDCSESFVEICPLVGRGRAEVGCYV